MSRAYSKFLIVIVITSLIILANTHNPDTNKIIDLSNPESRFSSFESEFYHPDVLNGGEAKSNSNSKSAKSQSFNYNKEEISFLNEKLTFLSYSDSDSDSDIKRVIDRHDSDCSNRPSHTTANPYYFLPVVKADINASNVSYENLKHWSNDCFGENQAFFEKLTQEETIITFISTNAKTHSLCADRYWIATSNMNIIYTIFVKDVNTLTLKNLSDDDFQELKVNGLKIMAFCQGFLTSLHSFYLSLKLYIGGLGQNPGAWLPISRPEVPEYMEKANIEFLSKFANFNPASRGEFGKNILEIDEKEIKTGDFIAIYRLDGLDPLIMFGSGARTGHSAVACWIEGELYILESQDGWYWPKRGIQRNKWKQWIQWAHNADFHVAILPLREEIRQKLNVEKAIHWFTHGIEGLNYGYHNFLFSWLDTAHENLPPTLISTEVLLPVFAILERISKSTADTIIGQALNNRIGTSKLSIPQVVAEASRRNITFEELIALPELEAFDYSDGKNYVCSCFVVGFWKAAELFDGLDVEVNEFTPKDVYQLDFFDKSYKDRRPQVCKDADPELEYCQIMGKYQVLLAGYSSVTPYSHMNEKCPSIAPLYERPDSC